MAAVHAEVKPDGTLHGHFTLHPNANTATALETLQRTATAYLHAPERLIRLNPLVVAVEQLPLDDPNGPTAATAGASTSVSASETKWRITDRLTVLGEALTSRLVYYAVHHPTTDGCRFAVSAKVAGGLMKLTQSSVWTVSVNGGGADGAEDSKASSTSSPEVTVTETTSFTVSPAWMHRYASTTALKAHLELMSSSASNAAAAADAAGRPAAKDYSSRPVTFGDHPTLFSHPNLDGPIRFLVDKAKEHKIAKEERRAAAQAGSGVELKSVSVNAKKKA
ncbi:hypothetical protein DFJ73DRAFT_803556 [Zopfochytrium polystomum]|nr:hypothetical protein DFJ73DRAFT_803556 [Zopfochytrium polystomum]